MARTKGKAEIEKKANALETLQVEYVGISDVRPNDYNPNRQSDHDFQLLLRSMREDGFTQPIVAQRDTATIVDGEHRWRAAEALGYDQIPVVFVDMTEEQMKIATLRHNRARGSEDIELAASVLRDLQQLGALDWAADSLMLDDVELNRMLEDIPAPEALAGDEFEQAWEPAATDTDETTDTATREIAQPGGGTGMSASSHSAIEAARQKEKRLAQAKTTEEREKIRQEQTAFFRLMLLFQGDEAELVKHVLGKEAANKLIEILNDWVERHPEDDPKGAGATIDA